MKKQQLKFVLDNSCLLNFIIF